MGTTFIIHYRLWNWGLGGHYEDDYELVYVDDVDGAWEYVGKYRAKLNEETDLVMVDIQHEDNMDALIKLIKENY